MERNSWEFRKKEKPYRKRWQEDEGDGVDERGNGVASKK